MWASWLNNSNLPALEQSIAFAQNRHTILAGNIANLDTPDYKTRDISLGEFQTQLREALEQSSSPGTSPGSSSSAADLSGRVNMQEVRDVSKQILYHDGSDVSLEHQVTEIAKNQGMHNTAVALMRSQFQTLQIAIRESVAV